jgi:hypothetical protein
MKYPSFLVEIFLEILIEEYKYEERKIVISFIPTDCHNLQV